MADLPGASRILLSHVGPGTYVSTDFVERGGGNAVIIELIPDGLGNCDLVTLDSAISGAGYSPAVDAQGSQAGVVAYDKIQVSTVLPFVRVQLSVNAGSWSVRVTPVDAGASLVTSVTGDINLAEYGNAAVSPANPMDTSLVTTEGAGATIGTTADAAVASDAVGTLSGKLRGLVKILADVWDSAAHLLNVRVAGSTVGRLKQGGQPRTSIVCALANTDYPAGAVIPAGTKRIVAWAANLSIVAVDEATGAAVGVAIPPNVPTRFPVSFGAGDSLVHAQSPNAGTTVYVTYLQD